jgi:ribonuclease G
MTKELVIGSNRHETKVAILEDDQLVEVYFQRANEYSLAGSIHKGRVTRVLPGMQSAFVDLGLERDAFLYVSDFFEENEDIEPLEERRGERKERTQQRNPERTPSDRLAEAQAQEAAAGLPEGEDSEIETEGLSSADLAADQAAAAVVHGRPEGERPFRERRGRRSRRRRSRGRGFPESKYAQPQAVSSSEVRETSSESGQEAEPQEMLILPGESLAKYRSAAAGSAAPELTEESAEEGRELSNHDQEENEVAADQPHEAAEELEVAEEDDLEAEAEEIELVDRVLGHHTEPPEIEEEKLEEVRQDTPAPETQESAAYDTSSAPLSSLETPEPAQTAHAVQDVTEEAARTAGQADTALQVGESESVERSEEVPPAQTASVREPGSRYMHRISRRMRRRRNRVEFSSGGANAAAPAFELETRSESRHEVLEGWAEQPDRQTPSISDLLKPGQEIIVQIAKEPLGQKGARITSHIALPGRYVVYMPTVNHLGVSRRIASEEERLRLKRILQTHRAGKPGGFIVRTAGEGVSEAEIAADMEILHNLWLDIRQKAEKKRAPALLHHDLDIVQRVLRDQLTDEFKAIWVDNEEMYEKVLEFLQRFQPSLVNRVKMYTRSAPIFDAFNITQELEKALRPKVWLKSGGYIVINQTEALVAIDINTGKYVGKSNRLEDTIVKTNLEAVKEIVRQIRLRDLGGIIVVDFIDMDERKNRQKIMQALEEAMRADKAPYKILQFNDFGLVAITRKRVKQSLERTLCSPCPYCEGAGYIKSVQTIIGEILVEAQKIANAIESKEAVLRVHPDVAKMLKASDNEYLEELEEVLKRPVLVKSDPTLHHEKFDLA